MALVKYLLAGCLYDIPSERQTEWSSRTEVALQRYLEMLDRALNDCSIGQLQGLPAESTMHQEPKRQTKRFAGST